MSLEVDWAGIRTRIRTVILSLNQQADGVVYRPSNAGQCALRLQWAIQGQQAEARDPRRAWAALQGTISEELFGNILELAGADILHPPESDQERESHIEPDQEAGFRPHIDRLFRWPEVNINNWTVLELKNLRTMAQIDLFLEGVYADNQYWAQAVSYLMQARRSIQIYAEAAPDSRWADLAREEVVPQQLIFFSIAKDPSTAMMMLNQRIKQTQKELNTPEKMKPEDLTRAEWKAQVRERLQEVGGDIDFHLEIIDRSDPAVADTWQEIVAKRRRIDQAIAEDTVVSPLYDIAGLVDDDLPEECRWYCPFLEQHQHLILAQQLTESVLR